MTAQEMFEEIGLQELKFNSEEMMYDDEDTYECPCCGKTYETYYDGYLKKFCCECGQTLDWRVEE